MPALPLMLIPGLMCDRAVWEPLLPWLAKDRECRMVDHGQADSLVQMAKQLLQDAPPHMVLAGHSMGARVALEVLRLAPERVKGVALLDTGYLPKPAGEAGEEEARKRFHLLKIAQEQGVRAMANEWVQGMVHPDRLSDAPLVESILAMFERKDAHIFACQINALLNRPDGSDVLRAIKVPALLMCGKQDAWSTPAQHQAMNALATHATFEVIDDAGHMAPMERPEPVALAMQRWLATI
ncbi:MAG: alpha/beta fold hydrolase [Limnohabitans sp.]